MNYSLYGLELILIAKVHVSGLAYENNEVIPQGNHEFGELEVSLHPKIHT